MTESLPQLRGRIASLDGFHDLVRALRALAGTHAREAQGALPGARSYLATVEDAISRVAQLMPVGGDAEKPQNAPPDVLLVILSEHGFVGAYNDRLLQQALAARRASDRVIIVGRRGEKAASEVGLLQDSAFSMTTHVGGVGSLAREITDALFKAPGLRVVFAHHHRGQNAEYMTRTVLPFDTTPRAQDGPGSPPLHHLAPADLMARLTSEYLFAELALALMDALACENSARLRAMETANRNVEDKLTALHQTERTLNQETVTEELMDLSTGVEAVMHPRV